jgi:hypothetical protein
MTEPTKTIRETITDACLARFAEYARDADNWSGSPLVGGNVGGDPADKGYILNLKKAGLITTWTDEGLAWLDFTDLGKALVLELGISIWEIDLLTDADRAADEGEPEPEPETYAPATSACADCDDATLDGHLDDAGRCEDCAATAAYRELDVPEPTADRIVGYLETHPLVDIDELNEHLGGYRDEDERLRILSALDYLVRSSRILRDGWGIRLRPEDDDLVELLAAHVVWDFSELDRTRFSTDALVGGGVPAELIEQIFGEVVALGYDVERLDLEDGATYVVAEPTPPPSSDEPEPEPCADGEHAWTDFDGCGASGPCAPHCANCGVDFVPSAAAVSALSAGLAAYSAASSVAIEAPAEPVALAELAELVADADATARVARWIARHADELDRLRGAHRHFIVNSSPLPREDWRTVAELADLHIRALAALRGNPVDDGGDPLVRGVLELRAETVADDCDDCDDCDDTDADACDHCPIGRRDAAAFAAERDADPAAVLLACSGCRSSVWSHEASSDGLCADCQIDVYDALAPELPARLRDSDADRLVRALETIRRLVSSDSADLSTVYSVAEQAITGYRARRAG